MATRTVEVVRTCAASPTVLWELLANVERWSEWGLYEEARLVEPGPDEPQGVGARRHLRADRIKTEDEIYVYEPPHRLAFYAISTSVPVADQRSEIRLEPSATGGTEIWWRTSYRAKIFGTGWMVDRSFKLFLTDTTRRLAVHAETGAPVVED